MAHPAVVTAASWLLGLLVLCGWLGCTTPHGETGKQPPPPASANGPAAEAASPLVSIAVVGGTDGATQARVIALLKRNGIDAVCEGSVVYGILVPRSQVGHATALLRSDAAKGGYWIDFPD